MVTHAASVPGDGGNSALTQGSKTVHMLAGIELTPRGIDGMAEYAATIREYVGYDIRSPPITSDTSASIPASASARRSRNTISRGLRT